MSAVVVLVVVVVVVVVLVVVVVVSARVLRAVMPGALEGFKRLISTHKHAHIRTWANVPN